MTHATHSDAPTTEQPPTIDLRELRSYLLTARRPVHTAAVLMAAVLVLALVLASPQELAAIKSLQDAVAAVAKLVNDREATSTAALYLGLAFGLQLVLGWRNAPTWVGSRTATIYARVSPLGQRSISLLPRAGAVPVRTPITSAGGVFKLVADESAATAVLAPLAAILAPLVLGSALSPLMALVLVLACLTVLADRAVIAALLLRQRYFVGLAGTLTRLRVAHWAGSVLSRREA